MKHIQPITLEAFLNISRKEAGFFDSFIYGPSNPEEAGHGYLFILGEMRSSSPQFTYFLNFLASIIKKEYYESRGKSAEENLSGVLERINDNPHILFGNSLPREAENIHVLAGALSGKRLVLGFGGDVQALLVKRKDITDLTALSESGASSSPRKIFQHLVTGEVEAEDRLMFATQGLLENLYEVGIVRHLSANAFPTDEEFKKFLHQHRFNIKRKGLLHYIYLAPSRTAAHSSPSSSFAQFTPALASSPALPLRLPASGKIPAIRSVFRAPFGALRWSVGKTVSLSKRVFSLTSKRDAAGPSGAQAPMVERSPARGPLEEAPPPYTQTVLEGTMFAPPRSRSVSLRVAFLSAGGLIAALALLSAFLFLPERQVETPEKTSFFSQDTKTLKLTIVSSPRRVEGTGFIPELESGTDDTASITATYGNAVYTLNSEEGLIVKTSFGTAGAAPGNSKEWISSSSQRKPVGGVDLAIDGSVWVLYEQGVVEEYMRGSFVRALTPVVEPPFERASKIFAAPGQKFLWILEQKHSRVIILAKDGTFVRQLHFPGLSNIENIYAAPDNTLYLLDSGNTYLYKAENL